MTLEELANLMNTYEQSGLTRKAFCAQEDLGFSRFRGLRRRWLQHQRDSVAALSPALSGDFLAFEPSPGSFPIELQYPSGVVIRLSSPDLSLLSTLIKLG